MPIGTAFAGGGGDGIDAPEYTDPLEETPVVRVKITPLHSTESYYIPVINDGVTMHRRKEGPLAITTICDVQFPAVGPYGNDWLDSVTYGAKADIEVRNRPPVDDSETEVPRRQLSTFDGDTDEYTTVHRGYVKSLGSGGATENTMRFRVGGLSQLLTEIPAGVSFNASSVDNVLAYVLDQLEQSQSTFDEIGVDIDQTLLNQLAQFSRSTDDGDIDSGSTDDGTPLGSILNTADDATNIATYGIPGVGQLYAVAQSRGVIDDGPIEEVSEALGEQTPTEGLAARFTRNQHTLGDVIRPINERIDIRLAFLPDNNGGVALTGISPNSQTHYARHLGGSTAVLNNNALVEISPVNALRLSGRPTNELVSVEGYDVEYPDLDGNYPVVVVEHGPTRERAGQTITAERTADIHNLPNLVSAAKTRLKRMIDTAGSGTISTVPDPQLRPYQTFVAQPRVGEEMPSIEYEIERVTHSLTADEFPRTELTVSLAANYGEMNVTERTEAPLKTETSEGDGDDDSLIETITEVGFI
ncbi:hypothetical protein [Halomicrobium sp. LC1Hm]|uniref:hypothetical protein n=1 Tax=Halomicrobium sp. LC1Hm TaxID=2610902 RepID=UPI0012983118|nr:hypothetical protein [Halomicrobium sp. LC1Hm]QGA82761.1 hypothetical protein LC1Hm_1717 [Halomicrobium sp. LC1Hm]